MRASHIWFALAIGWSLDCALSLYLHNHLQAGLTAAFTGCFLALGLFFRRKKQKPVKR